MEEKEFHKLLLKIFHKLYEYDLNGKTVEEAIELIYTDLKEEYEQKG